LQVKEKRRRGERPTRGNPEGWRGEATGWNDLTKRKEHPQTRTLQSLEFRSDDFTP
jgi:hypothetical protein